MKPIIKYRGGKSKEIKHFIKYVPQSFDRYIEPFLGGGALYFYLEPERAILNDINKKLMTFYLHARDQYGLMRKQLDQLDTIYSRNQTAYSQVKQKNPKDRVPNENENLYYDLRGKFNHNDGKYLDGVLYFFINKTAFSGMIRYNADGEYNVPFGRYANFNTNLLTARHSELLGKAELHSRDFSEIFALAKPGDFMFLDPPYDCVFHDYGNTNTAEGFGEEDHHRLAENFKKLCCKALMVIGKTPMTERLYKGYVVAEYHKNYAVNIRNRFKNDKIHMIVKNY